ncbi:hypothetical protein [Delftia sp. PS-11]|nr:hypothetical protein [Delftia sp. PS-11]
MEASIIGVSGDYRMDMVSTPPRRHPHSALRHCRACETVAPRCA